MKLSKSTLLFLGIAIVVILLVVVSVVYAKQNETKKQLAQEFAETQLKLSKISTAELVAQQEELESKLAQTSFQLEASKAGLTESVESIPASQAILSVARTYKVKVTEISSSGSMETELVKLDCSSLPITINVTGPTGNIVGFVNGLTDWFGTGVVKSVEINVPDDATPADEQPAEEQPDEEQPDEEQPDEEQPAEEQPAEEQTEGEQSEPTEETTATIHLQIYFYQGR